MKTRQIWLIGGLLLAACGSTARNHPGHSNGGSDAGGASANGNAGDTGDALGGEASDPCKSSPVAPASLVRLTFAELNASLVQLFDAEAAAAISAELELDIALDSFPPLASPREGNAITETNFAKGDTMARHAGSYVRENFEAVTQCAADFACVTDFVSAFGERAFRRALTDDEQAALEQVVAGAEALGASPEEGAEYGVYAVLESPHFLYRTEFGPAATASKKGEVRLSDDELASSLAFFLTGAPPDQGLLDAASAHDLGGPDQLAPHVERLLGSAAARQHLEQALGSYLGFSRLQTVILDPTYYPDFNAGLARAMNRELTLLFQDTLWSQPVASVLTSRKARVNASLAALYGVELPSSGLDADGFGEVELPETRAGLLTRAGALTATSRPDKASLVGRGIWVASALTCAVLPAFPDLIQELPDPLPPGVSERERAAQRMDTEPCSSCHVEFDPYGLALDEFDAMGRYRKVDPEGRPIDTAVELPAALGGAKVQGGVGLSEAISGKPFTTCLTQRFLQYALSSWGDTEALHCQAESLAQSAQPTFTDLLSNVALSRTFATRAR